MLSIIYVRVSTEEQHKQGYSIPSQLEACRARASSLGTEVVEFVDDVSGEILDRPVLSAAREMVRKGGVKYFICYDPDRFSRDLANQLIVAKEIMHFGVKLEFIKFKYENTPQGNFFFSILGAVAELEKGQIKERTARGRKQKAKLGGMTHGVRIYGYTYEGGKFTPNPSEVSTLHKIFQWCIEGNGGNTIAKKLNEAGIPSAHGKEWQIATVLRILKNPSYLGKMMLNKWDDTGISLNKYRQEKIRRSVRPETEWIPIPIPQIINKETFYKAQERLRDSRRLHCGHAIEEYLLSGVSRCGLCGSAMRGKRRIMGGKIIRYYVCSKYFDKKCHLPYIRAEKVEGEVWGKICAWVEKPELFSKDLTTDDYNPKEEINVIETSLTSAIKERARLLTLAQKDLIPLEEIEERLKEVKSRIDRLTTRKEELSRPSPAVKANDTKAFLESLAGKVESFPFHRRKQLVRDLIEQIIFYSDRIEIRIRQ